MPSDITTKLSPDKPVTLSSNYQLDARDRRVIDDQIVGVQKHLAESVIRGQQRSFFMLDPSSVSLAKGDVFCVSASSTADESDAANAVRIVTRATDAALLSAGMIAGIAATAAAPGTTFQGVVDGIVGPGITGLGRVAGAVRVNSARCQRVASLTGSDYAVGFVDSAGNLTISKNAAGAAVGGGAALTNTTPSAVASPQVGVSTEAMRADASFGTAIGTGTLGERHGFIHKDDKRDHDASVAHGYPFTLSGDVSGITDSARFAALIALGVRRFKLPRGICYITPGGIACQSLQGATIEGEAARYGSGNGSYVVIVGTSGARGIDARGSFRFTLRNLGIGAADLRFLGDLVDLTGGPSDTVGAIVEGCTFINGDAAPRTPAAPVCDTGGQPAVTVTGTCGRAFRGVVKIDLGGTTFSYSETGGGNFGDPGISADAATNPWGCGDARWLVTGVAIPAGGTYVLGGKATGLTLHFAAGSYTAGVNYRFGLGPRTNIKAPACYDSRFEDNQFAFGYDGVYISNIGNIVQGNECNPQLERYYAEVYQTNGAHVHGTATSGGVFAHGNEYVKIDVQQGDPGMAPWHIIDGNQFAIVDGLIQSNPGVEVRNGNQVVIFRGQQRFTALLARFVAGGANNIYAKNEAYVSSANWYTGSSSVISYVDDFGAFNGATQQPINRLFVPVMHYPIASGILDLQSPLAVSGGSIRGAGSLGVVSDYAVSGTTIDWTACGRTHALVGNVTFTVVSPSDMGARGLELYVTPNATTAYTITWPASFDWINGTPPKLRPGGSTLYVRASYAGDTGVGSANGRYRAAWYLAPERGAVTGVTGAVSYTLTPDSHLALTLTGNTTATFSVPPTGSRGTVEINQGGAGGYTFSFSPASYWVSGTAAGGIPPSSTLGDKSLYEWRSDGASLFWTAIGKVVSV